MEHSIVFKFICLLWLIVTLTPIASGADDSSDGVMFPKLRSGPENTLVVKESNVILKGNNVNVSLLVDSWLPNQDSTLLIDGYLFSWLGEAEPYPDRHFPELKIFVNGELAVFDDRFEAYLGAKNITDAIISANIDPWSITETPPFISNNQQQYTPELEELINLGAVEKLDGNYIAKWTAQRFLTLHLNSTNKKIDLSYIARPAFSLLPINKINHLSDYCLKKSNLNKFFGHLLETKSYFVIKEYKFPMGIDSTSQKKILISVDLISNKQDKLLFIATCGSDGLPIITSDSIDKRRVKADKQGILNVLTISEPSNK